MTLDPVTWRERQEESHNRMAISLPAKRGSRKTGQCIGVALRGIYWKHQHHVILHQGQARKAAGLCLLRHDFSPILLRRDTPMVCVLVGLGCRNNRTRRRLSERGLFSHSPEGWKPEIRMPAWLSPWEGPRSGSQVVLILPHAHVEERETELCYLFLKGH